MIWKVRVSDDVTGEPRDSSSRKEILGTGETQSLSPLVKGGLWSGSSTLLRGPHRKMRPMGHVSRKLHGARGGRAERDLPA